MPRDRRPFDHRRNPSDIMGVVVECGNCGNRGRLGDQFLNKTVKCPKCTSPVQVTAPDAPIWNPPPAAPPIAQAPSPAAVQETKSPLVPVAFVLAGLSILFFPIFLALGGVVCGIIAASQGDKRSTGAIVASVVLGAIGVMIGIVAWT